MLFYVSLFFVLNALGLAIPMVLYVDNRKLTSKGVLISRLNEVEAIVFDKTGTLTTGQFEVKAWHTNIDKNEFCRIKVKPSNCINIKNFLQTSKNASSR